jgi:hypothetical protein
MQDLVVFDKNAGMPRYTVTTEDIKKAESEYEKSFSNTNMVNSKTIYKRKHSRIAGILGEIVYQKLYPNAVKSNDITYDFDWEDCKLDVKCKYRTVIPNLNFEASFFLYQAGERFNADWYMFMSTIPTFKYVWLCGFISKKGILENPHTEIWKQGQIDENNNMTFREDTICLKYKYLNKVEAMGTCESI